MAPFDEDDAAQRRRRKQRHEGERTMEDGDVAEHGQEIFEPLPSRREWDPAGYLRINVLRDTLARLSSPDKRRAFHELAAANLKRWASEAPRPPSSTVVEVIPGDWGDVTLALTKRHGECFAVLNMANAYFFGGGYAHGQVAQEENMFRRTDCHFHDEGYNRDEEYSDAMHRLVSGADGRVYLDTASPRVCIKGPEERDGLGYGLLADEDVFPFFELRSAAVDMRGASFRETYDDAELRKRIAAQLDTCREAGVRHVVLSAFGCGAFQNPSPIVAEVYKQEVIKRKEHFDVVAFAIFHAGYGPDNFGVFRDIIMESR